MAASISARKGRHGYGIVQFRKKGGVPAIITGRSSRIVEQRCKELGITELHQGVSDKLECLLQIAQRLGIDREEIAYMGDDLNDLSCLEYAGVSACPCDAVEAAQSAASYVCRAPGGRGAVREFLDTLL